MSFLPGILTKNWQLKVLAVAMAVLLWTVPRFEGQSSQILDEIPVRVQLNDPNWALVGDPSPATVAVTVSGPAREIFAIGIDRPPVLIPMDEVSSGDTTVFLRTSWFRGSGRDGVVVENLRPEAVRLSFEGIEQRLLPLSVPVFGTLPQGISMTGAPVITPAQAAVVGAASRFQGVDSLRLQPLDLASVDSSGSINLQVDTTGLPGLTVLQRDVTVQIPTEATVAREFTDRTIILPALSSDPQLQARPTVVTIVLMGAQSLLDQVDPESLVITVPAGWASLAPGQEERVGLAVEGVPEFVEARLTPDWVLLRRPVGQ